MVLPCIGSLSQITGCPAARTASTSGGRRSPTFCAPIRAISVRRPGSRRGSRRSQSASNWSRPISGPTYVRVRAQALRRLALQRGDQPGSLGPAFRRLAQGIGVTHDGRADADAQAAVALDLGGADQDCRVQRAPALAVAADQRRHPAVVAATLRLVAADHPAGAFQRAAGDGRGEQRLAQHLAHVAVGLALDEVLGVRQVRHLLEVGTEHPAAVLADPRHHLQLLVHHHVQLVGFLAVVEEFHDLGQVRPGRRVAVGAADRVHHRQAVAHADVSLGRGADQGAFAGVDDEGPVGALLAQQQLAEETQRAGRGVAVDARLEAPLDHEVGAFAATDLVGDDPPDHFGVGLVVEVESFLAQFQRLVRQQRQGLLQRQQFLLQNLQRQQRRAVVERLEAALGDLPVGNQRQQVMARQARAGLVQRQVGQAVQFERLAANHVEQARAIAFRAVEQGERRRPFEQALQQRCGQGVHSSTSSVVTTIAQRLAAYSRAMRWCASLKSAMASATRNGWMSLE